MFGPEAKTQSQYINEVKQTCTDTLEGQMDTRILIKKTKLWKISHKR